jgi:hypothetical protein
MQKRSEGGRYHLTLSQFNIGLASTQVSQMQMRLGGDIDEESTGTLNAFRRYRKDRSNIITTKKRLLDEMVFSSRNTSPMGQTAPSLTKGSMRALNTSKMAQSQKVNFSTISKGDDILSRNNLTLSAEKPSEKNSGIVVKTHNLFIRNKKGGGQQHMHKKSMLLDPKNDLECCVDLQSEKFLHNGMKKAALGRSQRESLGISSYNRTRFMYPVDLSSEQKLDPIFEQQPHLTEFRKSHNRATINQKKGADSQARPVNKCYRDKSGVTYGLF